MCSSRLVGLRLDLSLARSAPGLICFPLCSSGPSRLSWLLMTGICPPKPEREALLAAVPLLAVWAGCHQSCVTGPLSRSPPLRPERCPLGVFLVVLSLRWCRMDLSLPSCWSEPSLFRAPQQPHSRGSQWLSRPHCVLCRNPVVP